RLLMPISSSLHDGCGVKIPCCYPCSSGNVPHCSRIIRHLPASRLDPVPQPLQRNTGCGADGEATNPLSSDTVWPPPPWLIIFNVMLKQSPDTVRRTTAPTVAIDGEGDAFEIIEGDLSKGILLVCDHATNALPEEYGTLGLPEDQLNRHIAHDIGVADVTRGLASAVGIPAVLSTYSRLLIDPNRGAD